MSPKNARRAGPAFRTTARQVGRTGGMCIEDIRKISRLLHPEVPSLVEVYWVRNACTLVYEWADGSRFAAVEPLGVVVAVADARGMSRRRYVA